MSTPIRAARSVTAASPREHASFNGASRSIEYQGPPGLCGGRDARIGTYDDDPVEQARLANHIECATREQKGELLARLAEERCEPLLRRREPFDGTTAQMPELMGLV